MLRSVDAQLLGVVLNMVPSKAGASYGYGYGYGYESDKASRHSKSSAVDRKKRSEYDTAPVPAVRTERPRSIEPAPRQARPRPDTARTGQDR